MYESLSCCMYLPTFGIVIKIFNFIHSFGYVMVCIYENYIKLKWPKKTWKDAQLIFSLIFYSCFISFPLLYYSKSDSSPYIKFWFWIFASVSVNFFSIMFLNSKCMCLHLLFFSSIVSSIQSYFNEGTKVLG